MSDKFTSTEWARDVLACEGPLVVESNITPNTTAKARLNNLIRAHPWAKNLCRHFLSRWTIERGDAPMDAYALGMGHDGTVLVIAWLHNARRSTSSHMFTTRASRARPHRLQSTAQGEIQIRLSVQDGLSAAFTSIPGHGRFTCPRLPEAPAWALCAAPTAATKLAEHNAELHATWASEGITAVYGDTDDQATHTCRQAFCGQLAPASAFVRLGMQVGAAISPHHTLPSAAAPPHEHPEPTPKGGLLEAWEFTIPPPSAATPQISLLRPIQEIADDLAPSPRAHHKRDPGTYM